MVVEFETVNFFLFSLASRAWCFFIQLFIESCVLPYYTVDGMISPHSRRWEQIVDDISTYQQIVLSKDGDGESQLRDIQTKCTDCDALLNHYKTAETKWFFRTPPELQHVLQDVDRKLSEVEAVIKDAVDEFLEKARPA